MLQHCSTTSLFYFAASVSPGSSQFFEYNTITVNCQQHGSGWTVWRLINRKWVSDTDTERWPCELNQASSCWTMSSKFMVAIMFQFHLLWLVSFLSFQSWVTPCGSDWGTPSSSGCTLHTIKNGDSGEYWCVSRRGASCRGINITVMGRGTANKMMLSSLRAALFSKRLMSFLFVCFQPRG